jgi:hypothetical protein
MKKRPILATLCYGLIALPCLGDTFTLKDGSTVEGAVLREEGDSYILEVQVTKSIKDERKISKSEILKQAREKLDLTAFAAIQKLVPVPDFTPADDYAPKISAATKFIEQFPGSSKIKEAKAILAELSSEAAAINSGGMKMSGKVLTSAEYKANAYEIDSRIAEAKIRRLVESGDQLAALRAFAEFDRDYRSTLSYGTLAPFITQVIKAYVAELKESLATLDERIKTRQTGLQQMAMSDRSATDEAIKEEAAAIEARYQAEKTGKTGWLTISSYHKASLDESIKFGESELVRLAAVKPVLGQDGGRIYREAYNAVHNNLSAATVSAAIANAKAALIPASYMAPLEAAVRPAK